MKETEKASPSPNFFMIFFAEKGLFCIEKKRRWIMNHWSISVQINCTGYLFLSKSLYHSMLLVFHAGFEIFAGKLPFDPFDENMQAQAKSI